MTQTGEPVTAQPPETDREEPEELLIEEISIDGMCGVY
jgi:mycofactocin precursor